MRIIIQLCILLSSLSLFINFLDHYNYSKFSKLLSFFYAIFISYSLLDFDDIENYFNRN